MQLKLEYNIGTSCITVGNIIVREMLNNVILGFFLYISFFTVNFKQLLNAIKKKSEYVYKCTYNATLAAV